MNNLANVHKQQWSNRSKTHIHDMEIARWLYRVKSSTGCLGELFGFRGNVRIPMHDYKSLCVVVMICATLVNTQTYRWNSLMVMMMMIQTVMAHYSEGLLFSLELVLGLQDKTRQWWETNAGTGASISVSLLYTKLIIKLNFNITFWSISGSSQFGLKIIQQWLISPILI